MGSFSIQWRWCGSGLIMVSSTITGNAMFITITISHLIIILITSYLMICHTMITRYLMRCVFVESEQCTFVLSLSPCTADQAGSFDSLFLTMGNDLQETLDLNGQGKPDVLGDAHLKEDVSDGFGRNRGVGGGVDGGRGLGGSGIIHYCTISGWVTHLHLW